VLKKLTSSQIRIKQKIKLQTTQNKTIKIKNPKTILESLQCSPLDMANDSLFESGLQ